MSSKLDRLWNYIRRTSCIMADVSNFHISLFSIWKGLHMSSTFLCSVHSITGSYHWTWRPSECVKPPQRCDILNRNEAPSLSSEVRTDCEASFTLPFQHVFASGSCSTRTNSKRTGFDSSQKKLINCQHPRNSLFFFYLLICLILSAWFAGVLLYLANV